MKRAGSDGCVWVLIDDCEGGVEDSGGRPPVLAQNNQFGLREASLKQTKRSAGCATKPVNRLVRVTYGKNILFLSCNTLQEFHLSEVCILKFIHKDKTSRHLLSTPEWSILLKQGISPSDHMAERAEVLFP